MNFQTDLTEQAELFAFSHRDLVSEDSDVWLYIDLFDQLNLDKFNRIYSYQGQAAKEPRLMLRAIFYGLTHGIVSGRRLSDACRNDNRFIVLSGGLRPDQRTFNRFIERHEKSLMELFVEIVRLAQRMKLVSLGRVAVDGSRFKAQTGVSHSMQYEKMGRAIGYIEEELKKLREDLKKESENDASKIEDKIPEEIKSKEARLAKIKRAKEEIEKEAREHNAKTGKTKESSATARKSLHDPEALSLADRKGRYQFGYNAQAAVDEKAQIIVACEVHPCATDYEAMPGILDQVEENCEEKPKGVLADFGYKSAENIHEIESRGMEAYLAIGKQENGQDIVGPLKEVQPIEQIQKKADYYECLAEKKLPMNSVTEKRVEIYIPAGFCSGCAHTGTCKMFYSEPRAEKGRQKRKYFSIPAGEIGESYKKYIERAKQETFAEVYRRRKVIVEPVFGNLKNKGIKILVTGRRKVKIWWKIACTAHNIEKIVGAMASPAATPA